MKERNTPLSEAHIERIVNDPIGQKLLDEDVEYAIGQANEYWQSKGKTSPEGKPMFRMVEFAFGTDYRELEKVIEEIRQQLSEQNELDNRLG